MNINKYVVLALVALGVMYITNNDIIHAQAPRMLTMGEICPQGSPTEITCKIRQAFPEEPEIMIAIAMAESNLNNNAINWNCHYEGKSRSCAKGDRGRAWSTDGGLFQIHKATKEQMTLDGNIKEARKKYDTQGKKAWTVWNTGAYKKYL